MDNKPTNIYCFDFDGTLFRMGPEAPVGEDPKVWFSTTKSLHPPFIPQTPPRYHYIPSVVNAAKKAREDENAFVLVLTGREPWFESRIREILGFVGLEFDTIECCVPDYPILDFKLHVLKHYLSVIPNIGNVFLWENDRDNLIAQAKLCRQTVPTKAYLVTSQPVDFFLSKRSGRYACFVRRHAAPTEDEKKKLFDEVARQQRNAPEMAMLRYQRYHPGGAMTVLVEHIGDLIHRMTESVTYPTGGYKFVLEKVDRGLRYLVNVNKFERTYEHSLRTTASVLDIPYDEYVQNANKLLDTYAKEHAKLPTYNKVQQLAQQAAVSLGQRRFYKTSRALIELKKYLVDESVWVEAAHQFGEDDNTLDEALTNKVVGLLKVVNQGFSDILQITTDLDTAKDTEGVWRPGCLHQVVTRLSEAHAKLTEWIPAAAADQHTFDHYHDPYDLADLLGTKVKETLSVVQQVRKYCEDNYLQVGPGRYNTYNDINSFVLKPSKLKLEQALVTLERCV